MRNIDLKRRTSLHHQILIVVSGFLSVSWSYGDVVIITEEPPTPSEPIHIPRHQARCFHIPTHTYIHHLGLNVRCVRESDLSRVYVFYSKGISFLFQAFGQENIFIIVVLQNISVQDMDLHAGHILVMHFSKFLQFFIIYRCIANGFVN